MTTDLVQQATSEKVALTVSFMSAFITGFVLAYVRQWRLALAMSSILPCMAIAGGVMNKFISTYKQCVPAILSTSPINSHITFHFFG